MKKYSILILSFIISMALFIILIIIQKKIINQDKLVLVYIIKEDIKAYSKIELDNLEEIYVKEEILSKYNFVIDISEIENKIVKCNIKKGEFLVKDMLIDMNNFAQCIKNSNTENISIKLNNDSVLYSNLITKNEFINLYITVDGKYLPKELENFIVTDKIQDSNMYTILYMEKVNPVMYLDENGNIINNNIESKLNAIILQVNKEQAIYLNSIKSIADFTITII